ncbi:MAG: DUF4157 domain-containing protein [Reyranella sp.]|uniref:eCIS core domain-containing protein n=1 Tax=Reyranella sp. TaxID=1929291 RepID=UPI003D0D1EB1
MQTYAISDSRRAQAARKGPGANRPTGKKAHDGLRFGASLADFPILPAEAAGSSSDLRRLAAGHAPSSVPASVREVLRQPGRPLPANLRGEMERRLGCDFSDVRLHTDDEAGMSAAAVAAEAYTVRRHIVFAANRFDPGSPSGRRLLMHELAHAAGHAPGNALPTGELRISTPAEPAERHAVAVAEGAVAPPAMSTLATPIVFRQPAPAVALGNVTVNHPRVTVPPPAGHGLKAKIDPTNATGVSLAVVGVNATIAAGTTVNSATGAVTIDAKQGGGSADIKATQATTGNFATAPVNFTAIPGKITSTTASARGVAGFYGGDFVHTFDPPKGSTATALELSHVNEKFATASGTTLTITGKLGTFNITINNPNSPTAGWDLDSTGTMAGPDHVTWASTNTDARPFVVNASNRTPANTLPQELTATQSFRNLEFPSKTYTTTVDTTTHRRAFEERTGKIKAVTSANAAGINEEVEEDYVGPTVFRNAAASPASIPVTAPAPPGGTAPAPTTSTITVDAEGAAATPAFKINAPNLGCTIDAAGVLTPGTTAGSVTVRAGDNKNFDETTVTLTAPPAPTPTPPGTP